MSGIEEADNSGDIQHLIIYGLVKDWRSYLDERKEGKEDIDNVRRRTRTGRPAGNEGFVKKIEKLTGRLLQRQKPGPKTNKQAQ